MERTCPVPSRWVLDALAEEARARALAAAERRVATSAAVLRSDLYAVMSDEERAAALDYHLHAVTERNALRDGRP